MIKECRKPANTLLKFVKGSLAYGLKHLQGYHVPH